MNEMFIGDRLTDLRMKKGVSEQKMSRELGMAKTYIWNICAHKAQPSMAAFLDICEYFEITPAEYFEPSLENDNYELLLMTEKLSDLDKEFIKRIICTLINEVNQKTFITQEIKNSK